MGVQGGEFASVSTATSTYTIFRVRCGTMLAELIKAWDMLLVFIFVIRTLPIGMSIFAIIVGWYRS